LVHEKGTVDLSEDDDDDDEDNEDTDDDWNGRTIDGCCRRFDRPDVSYGECDDVSDCIGSNRRCCCRRLRCLESVESTETG